MKKKTTEYITPMMLAKRWHMNVGSLKNWRTQKKGPPFIKIGSEVRATQVLYKLSDVEKFESKNYWRGKPE